MYAAKTLPKEIHLTSSFCKIRLSKWYFFKVSKIAQCLELPHKRSLEKLQKGIEDYCCSPNFPVLVCACNCVQNTRAQCCS